MEPFTMYILGFLLVTVITLLYYQLLRPQSEVVRLINKIPGYRAFPLIGTTWIFFGAPTEKILAVLEESYRRFPGIHRIWFGNKPEIRIAKAEYVEKILASTRNINKSFIYNFSKPWLGDGLLIAKDEKWHKHRKIITPTFHFSILDGFCELFAEHAEILVDKLKKHSGTGEAFDVCPYITRAALDIICETAMGLKMNAQNATEDNEYVNAVYEMSEMVFHRFLTPWLHPEFIFKRTAIGKKHQKVLDILHGFTSSVIDERRVARRLAGKSALNETLISADSDIGKKKRLAFLDLLLESMETSNVLNLQDVRHEVDTFMFEGHDTSTSGTVWCLFVLGLYEDVQQRVFEEIESIFGDSDRPATIHDLNEMIYLERVLKETLRIYSSVPYIARVLSEDVEIGSYKIPKGTYVGIDIYFIHRDPEYFPNPEIFDPDRFLPENTVKRHPYAFIPFSAGPRNCIGQKFALLEEKALISAILRKYKVRAAEKNEDVILMPELVMRPKDGIKLYLEDRKHESPLQQDSNSTPHL